MTRIFIAKPPKEILENALAVLGYTDAYEMREFSKKQLTRLVMTKLQEIFLELAAYYPVDSKHPISLDMKAGDIITVLKHLCEVHGFNMTSRERGKFRVTHYRIYGQMPEEVIVRFI
jgi:hypothetical protein